MAINAKDFADGFTYGAWSDSYLTADWRDDSGRVQFVTCNRCPSTRMLAIGCDGPDEAVAILFDCGHIFADSPLNPEQVVRNVRNRAQVWS
jgi:hypothetical protein